MRKKVLIIAFYYPPSSAAAVQRILKATEYLPEFGWDSIILTAKPSVYEDLEESQVIPDSVAEHVYRTKAFDVNTHLSIRGKHFGWMSTIDRWSTWIPGALIQGLKIIKKYNPDLICSTTPIPSANIIASVLAKHADIPWVADYQDPFSYHNYPTSQLKTMAQKAIDKATLKNCSAAIFATENVRDLYKHKFSTVQENKLYIVENGFDETNWRRLEGYKPSTQSPFNKNKFSLFYSGVLYPNGRNPMPLFEALSTLKAKNIVTRDSFELVFQGTGDGEKFTSILSELDIVDLVKFTSKVPYLDSLYYMKAADALTLIQDEVFNMQVPGKLYEYFRTGRPVLAIAPNESATAKVAGTYQLSKTSNDSSNIALIICDWIKNATQTHNSEDLQHFSRYTKTAEFADIFDFASNTKINKFT